MRTIVSKMKAFFHLLLLAHLVAGTSMFVQSPPDRFTLKRVLTWPAIPSDKTGSFNLQLKDRMSSDLHEPEYLQMNNDLYVPSKLEAYGFSSYNAGSSSHDSGRRMNVSHALPLHDKASPLADLMILMRNQEKSFLLQAARCRSAIRRMMALERIIVTRGRWGNIPPEITSEVTQWRACSKQVERDFSVFQKGAASKIASILKEHDVGKWYDMPSVEEYVTSPIGSPDHHSEEDETLTKAKKIKPSIRRVDGRTTGKMQRGPSFGAGIPAGDTPLPQHLEDEFRIGTWYGIPIYGVTKTKDGNYEYAAGTELHLVWDVDQSKLVGEGTNDVELVLKCVLWWKEELQHDMDFIPPQVDLQTRHEFIEYCKQFNMSQALDSMIHFLSRPGLKEFVNCHPQAKWWTFTNKDRTVAGQIVRDVSDENGLVGMFQDDPHEVSGRPVVDANKLALQLLDISANKHAGIVQEERPLVGVRGQQKDMARIAKLISKKNKERGMPDKPVTIVLLDDKDKDAYGNCQANDERCLAVLPPYDAVSVKFENDFVDVMEQYIPLRLLRKFFKAFRSADSSHALVQCVEIMSDDQSTLLKRQGIIEDPIFEWRPKLAAEEALPPAMFRFVPKE
mmetsp:Transcript_48153/g.151067  ORF Transcript_48153/g.151067 Transcript_48153/m.151067 type:complete len:619 (+) Transcript_48153:254-2110(+)